MNQVTKLIFVVLLCTVASAKDPYTDVAVHEVSVESPLVLDAAVAFCDIVKTAAELFGQKSANFYLKRVVAATASIKENEKPSPNSLLTLQMEIVDSDDMAHVIIGEMVWTKQGHWAISNVVELDSTETSTRYTSNNIAENESMHHENPEADEKDKAPEDEQTVEAPAGRGNSAKKLRYGNPTEWAVIGVTAGLCLIVLGALVIIAHRRRSTCSTGLPMYQPLRPEGEEMLGNSQ